MTLFGRRFGWQGHKSGGSRGSFHFARWCALGVSWLVCTCHMAAAWRAFVPNINDGTISVISTNSNRVVRTITGLTNFAGTSAAVSPGGGRVYVVDIGSGLYVINGRTNKALAWMQLPESSPYTAALNLDGTRLYIAYSGDQVSVLDVTTLPPTVLSTLTYGSGGGLTSEAAVAVNPSDTRLYLTDPQDQLVQVVDTAVTTILASVATPAQPRGVAVTPDGTRAYVTEFDPNVQVIDTASNTIVAAVSLLGMAGCSSFCHGIGIAFSPDGTRAYVADDWSGDVFVIDTATNTTLLSIEENTQNNFPNAVGFNAPYGISLTPDGKRAYVADGQSYFVGVIDTETNILTKAIDVGQNPQALGQFIDPAPYRILGWVRTLVDGVKVLAPGVTVTLTGPGGRRVTTTSNARGRFVFNNLPTGLYSVGASAPGMPTCVFPSQAAYLQHRNITIKVQGAC